MTSRPQPETRRSGRPPPRPGRSSSSAPVHRLFFPCPDTEHPWQNSAGGCSSAALRLPVSSPENGPEKNFFSYPMPTHSIHNRIAFAITVFASPRQMPKPIIKTAANSSTDWAIAFCLSLAVAPFCLMRLVYTCRYKISAKKKLTQTLSKSAIMTVIKVSLQCFCRVQRQKEP